MAADCSSVLVPRARALRPTVLRLARREVGGYKAAALRPPSLPDSFDHVLLSLPFVPTPRGHAQPHWQHLLSALAAMLPTYVTGRPCTACRQAGQPVWIARLRQLATSQGASQTGAARCAGPAHVPLPPSEQPGSASDPCVPAHPPQQTPVLGKGTLIGAAKWGFQAFRLATLAARPAGGAAATTAVLHTPHQPSARVPPSGSHRQCVCNVDKDRGCLGGAARWQRRLDSRASSAHIQLAVRVGGKGVRWSRRVIAGMLSAGTGQCCTAAVCSGRR